MGKCLHGHKGLEVNEQWGHAWVQVEAGGVAGLQPGMAIVTDKGKSSKEQGNLVVKEAVAAMMSKWQAPFRCAHSQA